jgi:protein-S-isoprenylcysteine O-methyltransferase Ste14
VVHHPSMSEVDERPTSEEVVQPEDAANVVARVEGRLDDLAHRFDRSDWIELFAAVLLALATVVAAWSAYQATRWGGVQTVDFSNAAALRAEANETMTVAEAGLEIDVEMFSTWLVLAAEGNERGAAAIRDRLREEFRPAFDAWLGDAAIDEIPAGRPFDLPLYDQLAGAEARAANELFREADAAAADARAANQTGDDFVLVAVVMATVLFFTGVSTKLRGRWVRIVMLLLASALFLVGVGAMLSLPQNVGI